MQGQTGSYVTTSLVTAPNSAALVTLATARDELDITDPADTSNDARLTRFINEISASIANYCNRVFGLATWQDVFRPSRGVWGEGVREANNPLKLTKRPISTATVSFSGNTHSSLLIDGIVSTQGITSGMPIYGAGIPLGATVSNVMPSAILLSAAATATASAVTLGVGVSVVETISGVDTQLVAGTDFEIDRGSMLSGDEGASLIYRLDLQGRPRTWCADKVTVAYQAGYALPNDANGEGVPVMPLDLQTVCLLMVTARFRARGRDPMLVEQTQGQMVGTQRYWVGGTPGQKGAFPPEIASILDNYRTPVVA